MLKSVLLAVPLSLSALALSVAASAASDLTQRDAACTHIATVQYLDCEVAVLYTCPSQAGVMAPLVREEAYGDQGYDHFEVDTANGGMIVTGDANGTFVIRTNPKTLVETPMAQVIKSGAGRFVAQGTITFHGATKPAGQKVSVKATGDTPKLSGIATVEMKANVAIDLPQPIGPSLSVAKAYLVPSLGIYLSGEETAGTFFKSDKVPHRPLSISLPGSPGFDTIKPSTCGGSLSLLETPTFPEGVPS